MNNYKDLALYDMKSARANYEYELWNKVGKECRQVCEKFILLYPKQTYLFFLFLNFGYMYRLARRLL